MPPLKTILRTNAASCLLFGLLFVAIPKEIAGFLGTPPAPGGFILVIGILLILNGVHLLHVSRARQPPRGWVMYFSAGDFAWVLGTLWLAGTGLWISEPAGVAAALAVAAAVGTMGMLQLTADPDRAGMDD